MPFDHPEAYFEDGVEVPDGIPVFPFGGVLTEIHVQFPVEVIFYPPMAPDLCIEGFSGVRCAADVIAGLVLGLAGFLEIALRADTDDGFKVGPGLIKVQEPQLPDDIAFPGLHPAVAAVHRTVPAAGRAYGKH